MDHAEHEKMPKKAAKKMGGKKSMPGMKKQPSMSKMEKAVMQHMAEMCKLPK